VLERARELERTWAVPSKRESKALPVSTSLSADSTCWIAVLHLLILGSDKGEEEERLRSCDKRRRV
jgi:hypothetical protein